MGQGPEFLDGFRHDMQQDDVAQLDGTQIAIWLCHHLEADRETFRAPIADVHQWACNVEIELKTGALWTIECLQANAYHFYPAHIREDGSVVWPNIWVADDMKLDETIAQIRDEVFGMQGQRH
jgi:hypothetical protein